MAGYVVATFLAFFASNIEMFIVARFFMGFFAAGGDVVGRAIIRDLYRGQPMQRMLARVFLIQAVSPILGPIVGSQLTAFASWQAVFLLFACIVLLLLLAANFVLLETLPVARRRSSTPIGLARGYIKVAKDRVFIGLMIYAALQLSALFVYLNFAPFIYQNAFDVSPTDFGFWLAVNGLASYIGVQFGAYIAKYIKGQWFLAITSAAGAVVGLVLVINSGGEFWITETAFAFQLFIFGASITIIPTIALYNHGSEAGTASSLLGVFNFAFASALSAFYFLLDSSSTADVGVLIGSLFAGSLFVLLFVSRPWTIPDLRKPDVL
jgi:DHA1 family bicyclomycin/chloramphenicol resistance-like MFS transporter